MAKIRFLPLTGVSGLLLLAVVSFQNCSPGFSLPGLTESSSTSTPIANSSESLILTQDALIASQQYACQEPVYQGFACVDRVLRTSEGRDYSVRFRWNRVATADASNGTVIWVLGNDGRRQWRTLETQAISTQDDFDSRLKIRSVEIEFLDPDKTGTDSGGGYWVHGGGYYSSSLAYLEAVKYVAANLKVGSFMNHVGGSNGTMVAAYALSHFGVGALVDRFVFHAGPFLPNLEEACDPNHFASFNRSPAIFDQIKRLLGTWSYLDPARDVCGTSDMIFRNSVLGNATRSYPSNALHVVMGAKEATEGFGEWILQSNLQWYSQVQAAEKTRVVLPNIGHQMDWDSVNRYAPLSKPGTIGVAPLLTFSAIANGPAVAQIAADARVYGLIQNIDASSAMGCMRLESEFSKCDDPNNWSALPNGDWTYSGGVWRSSFIPAQVGLRAGSAYKGFNINMKTGQRTPTVRIQIQPASQPASTLTFSSQYNGSSVSRVGLNSTVYGVSKNLPATGVMGCMQEASQFALCNDPKNWTAMPNAEWSYANGEWRTQFVPARIGVVAGKTYMGFHVDSLTLVRTNTVTFTVDP